MKNSLGSGCRKRPGGAHSACCIRLDHPQLPAAIAANDQRVAKWLAAGKQGEMDYLKRMLPQNRTRGRRFQGKSGDRADLHEWVGRSSSHTRFRRRSRAPVGYILVCKEIDYHARGQAMLRSFISYLAEISRSGGGYQARL